MIFSSKISLFFFIAILLNIEDCSGCLTQSNKPKNYRNRNITATKKTLVLDEPLYEGTSIKFFRGLCKNAKKITELEILYEASEPEVKPENLEIYSSTSCLHPTIIVQNGKELKRNYNRLELFYVQEFQHLIDHEEGYSKNVALVITFWGLFVTSFALMVFLAVVGHFDYRTLPLISSLYQINSTHGLQFKQYSWMQFLVLPGNHAMFGPHNRDQFKWLKYKKRDEAFDWKSVTNYKFKFLDRSHVSRYLSDEEVVDRKKKLMKQGGWDFLVLDKRKTYTDTNSVDSKTPGTTLRDSVTSFSSKSSNPPGPAPPSAI